MTAATQFGVSRLKPVTLWAGLGAIFLAVQLYVYGRWIGSGDFHPTAPGPDPVPAKVLSTIHSYQIINSVVAVVALGWFVWGVRRTGRLDSIRLLMVGWLSAYWLDPWLDFLRPMFTYNSYAVNYGCWCQFIPGWHTPNGARIAEPLLIDPASYFYCFTTVSALAWWVMRRVRAAKPAASPLLLGLAGFAAIWVSMALLDVIATRYFGFDAWPIAFRSVSLWGGQAYQFPIYEFLLFPSTFVACAFLLLRLDADGGTVIERGVGSFSRGAGAALRVLAFIAFCNVANLTYTTAMGVHALFADPWPATTPSWLADQQCGPMTGRRCAAPAVASTASAEGAPGGPPSQP